MHRRRLAWSGLVLPLLLACAACGGDSPAAGDDGGDLPPKPEPVTLKYYTNNAPATMELEQQLIAKKFPHVTLETTFANTANQTLPHQLVAAGYIPDLISYSIGSFWDFKTSGLLSDLKPLMQKYKFDTGRFLPNVLGSVEAYSSKNEVLFIPHNLSANVLYYNKDIFDKFGAAYPVDGMTWDDVHALARTLTRRDGDKQYKGFAFQHQNLTWKNQLLQPLVDPATFKTVVNRDGWKRWVRTMADFYLIPGNEPAGSFNTTFDIAMHTGPNIVVRLAEAEQSGLIRWDITSLPSFAGAKGGGTQMISPFYAIPPVGQHRETVYQIIDYMLTDEIQSLKARHGLVPIVRSAAAEEQFGKDLPGVEGKNLKAFFKDVIGDPFPTTPYDDIAKTVLYRDVLPAYYRDGKDINTIFREAEEQINRLIQEQLQ